MEKYAVLVNKKKSEAAESLKEECEQRNLEYKRLSAEEKKQYMGAKKKERAEELEQKTDRVEQHKRLNEQIVKKGA
jgi:hypothetical protein